MASSSSGPSAEQIASKSDLAIALCLAAWPALTVAVQNNWGGPDSSEKRDWFAGAISDLLQTSHDADAAYVEEFMLNVMVDEFEVNVDDGTAADVAARILDTRDRVRKGDFKEVDGMLEEWSQKQKRGEGKIKFEVAKSGVSDGEEEESSGSDDDDDEQDGDLDGGVDVDMDEAPPLVSEPGRPPPEVDEDGFTKVGGRRRK